MNTPPTSAPSTNDPANDNFLVALWSSIFTPGPTPPLLLATNITFATLQFLLFALLLTTYSVHFFALSCISGALWASINWFAKELRAGEEADRAKREKEKEKGKGEVRASDGEEEWEGDGERSQELGTALQSRGKGGGEGLRERSKRQASVDTDTETETEDIGRGRRLDPSKARTPELRIPTPASNDAAPKTGSSAGALSTSEDEVLLKRPKSVASVSEGVSTDSEWEKVDEER